MAKAKIETRQSVIEKTLGSVYAPDRKSYKGTMIEALANDLDQHWDLWLEGEGEARYARGLEYAAHMKIWNWYAGGGTAEIAARKVVEAVEGMSNGKE